MVSTISEGAPVSDSITDYAPYDIWEFTAYKGEQYSVDMQASNGLAPLMGLRDPSGNMIVRSDMFEDGTVVDADVDGLATLFFEIPADGLYAIVASRVGTDEGVTTGDYTLWMTRIAGPLVPDNTYLDVVFRCQRQDVTTVFAVMVEDITTAGGTFTVRVYGIDGLVPVIRVGGDDGSGEAPCSVGEPLTDAPQIELTDAGVSLSFDGESITSVATSDVESSSVPFLVTIGSLGGASGRVVMSITGLDIEGMGDTDIVTFRSGPRAKTEKVTVWMMRDGLSRLDPSFIVPDDIEACKDVGLRSCTGVLSGAALSYTSATGDVVATERLDAAARVSTGTTDAVELIASSQNPRTTGKYQLWFSGSLP